MPTIKQLFRKVKKGNPVIPTQNDGLNLIEKFGIEGDINANINNPRQVLITSLETLDKFDLKPGELKENIVVKDLDVDRLESGTVIQIGESVQIRITFNCEPCSFVEGIRKGLAKNIRGNRGILGVVIRSGHINLGNEIKVLGKRYDEIPFEVYDRFKWLIKQIPEGKVLTYKQIIKSLGLFSVYFRVLPNYIRRAEKEGLLVYRIVDSDGQMLSFLDGQMKLLLNENVAFQDSKVDIHKASWNTENLYY